MRHFVALKFVLQIDNNGHRNKYRQELLIRINMTGPVVAIMTGRQ